MDRQRHQTDDQKQHGSFHIPSLTRLDDTNYHKESALQRTISRNVSSWGGCVGSRAVWRSASGGCRFRVRVSKNLNRFQNLAVEQRLARSETAKFWLDMIQGLILSSFDGLEADTL
jgi:hypothetical protein